MANSAGKRLTSGSASIAGSLAGGAGSAMLFSTLHSETPKRQLAAKGRESERKGQIMIPPVQGCSGREVLVEWSGESLTITVLYWLDTELKAGRCRCGVEGSKQNNESIRLDFH